MSEWNECRSEEVHELVNLRWLELWKFNRGVEPKFWFGDRVKFHSRSAVVVGMQWRSEERSYQTARGKRGWCYGVIFSPDGALHWVDEDNLVADDGQS